MRAHKLYCYAAIFLIGSGALRGCVGAASRHIPNFLEKVNPVRIVKEHPGYAYGAKMVVESIDSLDFGDNKKKLYSTRKPPKDYFLPSKNYYLPFDASLSYQQKSLDDMMREVNRWSILYSSPLLQNEQSQQQEFSEYEEWSNQIPRNNDSCSTANIWHNPIPLKKAHYLQIEECYPAN